MTDQHHNEHAFVVDTLAHLIEHIAQSDESETGNKEILYMVIAKELRYRSEQILKT